MKKTYRTPIIWLGLALVAPSLPAQEPSAPAAPPPADQPAPPPARRDGGLRFNFRGAPLEKVLEYMSEAAGFVIVLETPVRGTVDMWSAQPVSRDEAVQLLNVALNKNGYAATVQGRNLIIATKEEAKKRNIPIHTGNDPAEIPPTAEMVMQIIPLRRIDAVTAARDLATLIPSSATLTANQDSNSLIVTDTQINVRHIVEIVAALDGSADTVTTMRVFQLKNADPTEMAQLITSLFQTPTSSRGGQTGGAPGGFFGGPGMPPGLAMAAAAMAGRGGFPGSGRGGSSRSGSGSTARFTPVVAIADPRTDSVVVTASKETMPQIVEIVNQLDANLGKKQKVFTYTLENADVKQVEEILRNLFQSSNTRGTSSTQTDALSQRAQSNTQARGTSPTTMGGVGSAIRR